VRYIEMTHTNSEHVTVNSTVTSFSLQETPTVELPSESVGHLIKTPEWLDCSGFVAYPQS
jgi:hypothetical protein